MKTIENKNFNNILATTKNLRVYIALLLAMVFWGFSFIWTKGVLEFYRPISIILIRLLISSVFMLLISLWLKRLHKIDKSTWKLIILLSFFEPFLYFIGENYGLSYVSSTITSVMISLIPLFSPIAAYFFFKEKISILNIVGIFVSIIGVILVIFNDDFSLDASPIGLALILLAVISAIAYSIIVVQISSEVNIFTIITYQNMIGVIWFIPLFFIIDFNHFMETGFLLKPFLSIIQLAIFASSIAFILFTYGIRKIGVTKANMWTNAIPVFTAIFAWVLLGERLSMMNMTGIVVVITGLFLSQFNQKTFARAKLFFFRWKNGDKIE